MTSSALKEYLANFDKHIKSIASNAIIASIDMSCYGLNNIEVFMKREDLIDAEIIGNKYRKLLAHLKELDPKTGLITMGGAYSNHILSTSYLTKRFDIPTTGIIRGDELSSSSNHVLEKSAKNGMRLLFISRESFKYIREHGDYKSIPSYNGQYFIPEGGFSRPSKKGAEGIVDWPVDSYDHVFCGCGTGTTIAGIHDGLCKLGFYNTEVHGICAVKAMPSITKNISELIEKKGVRINLYDQYAGGKFGRQSRKVKIFMHDFYKKFNIELDFNYTAKMMLALIDLADKKIIHAGESVLAIHTGGWETAGLKHLA